MDSLTDRKTDLERKLEKYERMLQDKESQLVDAVTEKDDEISEWKRKYGDVQRRLTEVLRNGNGDGEATACVEEVFQLRQALAEAIQGRDQIEIRVKDLDVRLLNAHPHADLDMIFRCCRTRSEN